jgi:hypothetical protein
VISTARIFDAVGIRTGAPRVWPSLVMEENNLKVQTWAPRKAIGASAISTAAEHGHP